MKADLYLALIAQMFTDHTLTHLIPYCAPDVVYISGSGKVTVGKQAVEEFLHVRDRANSDGNDNQCYGYPAVVKESDVPSIPVGTACIVLEQFDRFYCAGFMTVEVNDTGRIKKMHFHTEKGIRFHPLIEGTAHVFNTAKNARDAIFARALGYGLIGGNFDTNKYVQRYDVFQKYNVILYNYIYHNLFDDFTNGIQRAAGYTYVAAMIEALNRARPDEIPFTFDPQDATDGVLPEVPERYREWIAKGYEMGKDLFFGFLYYAGLWTSMGHDEFDYEMTQSFMDMCLYGSIQVNRELDLGMI